MKPLTDLLRLLWRSVRRLSGDDAYERYLAHHAAHHRDG
ncbi:MAG: YbdD/YjiX family protein, partial [Methylobacterium sp.]|nr:YbdD/YjiX family protein [Methylobacterium sp.]